ncbi:hypothetical protein HOS99_gp107 [Staphylococcus phage phiSA_BS1]|uniref:Uncharacterized protein n=2 Tax=Baoshanvirus TaxID=2732969 RepID=A0A2P1MXQ5_9CAUD|nr:hypothetical protein HOS99_gp107 [Staphylococcus phage phiSA_BS1]YP_009800029.1 hypothetical protein HOT02_gp189 [Staphylococcus phage phiSA_BS2]AVP40351.1 hypothetical protein [Staphylococcus phage phiSA_BS1]AVR55633.1 hypothetical protein phiSABS2_189 [Staphylococcus phage phiSA_BS2]
MNKEQIIKDILERMEDKGISLKNLSFDGDYKITINELNIEFTYSGDQATIFYDGVSKRVGFLEEVPQEVVALLPLEEWEEGQLVRNMNHTRVLVTPSWDSDMFNLLDDETYKLEFQYTYTTAELKEMGWERV